ncbi:MAG: hypothetical protein O9301_05075 [Leptospira sp.]|nr:hypothetical protein [Leptospira sp.]
MNQTKQYHYLQILAKLLILLLGFCKPPELNNPSDPNSRSFFENAALLCAIGYYQSCNPCVPAPKPWDSFVAPASLGQTFGLRTLTDRQYNTYGMFQSSNNFGFSGIPFSGTNGTTTNAFISKKSATGLTIWDRYVGEISQTRFDLIHRERDGLYFFLVTTTNLPSQINTFGGTPGISQNSVVGKFNEAGELLWTTYINNGSNGNFTILGAVIDSLDQSGLYAIGRTTNALVGTGTVIGTSLGNDWFFQKISYDGNTISTRYINFPAPVSNFQPLRIVELPNATGFYVIALVSADLNGTFTNGLNTFPGVSGNVVMKLDPQGQYVWHRYLGDSANSPTDSVLTVANALPNSNLVTSAAYSGNAPSLGLPHPNPGNASSIFYLLNPNGSLINSSFFYNNTNEYIVGSKGFPISNEKILISGGKVDVSGNSGLLYELDSSNFRESLRITRTGNVTASAVKHCDGSFTALTFTTTDIPGSILPKGSASINSYFSRFKP